jgi:hypothetical protein
MKVSFGTSFGNYQRFLGGEPVGVFPVNSESNVDVIVTADSREVEITSSPEAKSIYFAKLIKPVSE